MGLLGSDWDDPKSMATMQLAAGLLGGGNFGQALGRGLAGYSAQMTAEEERKAKRAYAEEQKARMDAARQEQAMRMSDQRAKQEYEQRFRGSLQGATPEQAMQGGGGPSPQNAQRIGGLDWQALARQYPDKIDEIKNLAEANNFGRQTVARTVEVEGPGGAKMIRQLDQFGRPVEQDVNGYVAPQLINQGNRQTFAKPQAGQSFDIGMSPSEQDASRRGGASNNLARERFAFDQKGGVEGGKPPSGYRWAADGTLEAIPGGPAAGKVGGTDAKVNDAKHVLAILDMADPLLKVATGSYAGAAADQVARAVGVSTKGAEAAAQLKSLQGALISKMPKMSGPQSDKDVQLYREMAGQIGDSTLPAPTRRAAMQTIRTLNEKYAGGAPANRNITVEW